MDNLAGSHGVHEVTEKLRGVLAASKTLTLATTAQDVPWSAGGFFADEGLFDLTMILEKTGTTMSNIRQNPLVAVTITTGNAFEPFAQAQADVEVLTEETAIAEAHARLQAKASEINALLGIPIDTVVLHVRTWKVTDFPAGWLPAKVLTNPGLVSA